MKIQEINIKNFRGYGENPDEEDGFFKFKDMDKSDIVLITGHNGYGKTSLYEAIEWCMTDDIKALRKHTENVNNKNTLKKSHYLKFQSIYDNQQRKRMREVVVRIIFDNNKQLIRKTKCDSLHQNEYFSLIVDEKGKTMKEEKENNEVKEFIKKYTGQSVENFFRLSFCGQAYSQDLVYDTAAKERGGIWLSFLGMDVINKIITNSDARSNPLLGKKQREVKKIINESNAAKEKINKLFQTNNWGSIVTYCQRVSEKIEFLNDFQEELKEIGIIEGFPLKKEGINDIIETLGKSNLLKEKIQQIYNKDVHKKENCIREYLIKEYRRNRSFLQKSEVLMKLDIVKLQQRIGEYIKVEEGYQNAIKEIEKIELEIKSCTLTRWKDSEEIFFLTENLVQRYEKEREVYEKVFSKSQMYGLKQKEQKTFLNMKRLFYYSEKYRNQIDIEESKLAEKREILKTIDCINQRQKEMLLQVQSFINQREKIEQCPVCGSSDFFVKGEDAKDKLLSIIENEISDGDESIQKYNADIVTLETRIGKWKKSYNKKIEEKFKLGIVSLENIVNECIQTILEYLHGMKECNRKMMELIQIKRGNLQKSLEDYNEFVSKYSVKIEFIQEKVVKAKKVCQTLESILEERFQFQVENIEQLGEKEQRKVRRLIRRNYLEKKAIQFLDDILEYDIGQENLLLLEKYVSISHNGKMLEKKKEMYEAALLFRQNVNNVAKSIQNEMLEKYIKNNEMINVVYGFINPHPFFREIKIDNGSTEMNIKSTQRDDIFLDHVFSEAQMKVLSLSIFLGLNLSIKNSWFEQVYIDDPVQSMDDINMVSFIDLLRALGKTENINKNFVIGTHDDNFSKLLKIKFRHRSYIEYHFESYSKEGPIIRIKKNKSL